MRCPCRRRTRNCSHTVTRSGCSTFRRRLRTDVSARIIDGKAIARKIRAEQAQQVERLVARQGLRPGLSVILVGANAASRVYVRNKIAACREVGIRSDLIELPGEITQAELLRSEERRVGKECRS